MITEKDKRAQLQNEVNRLQLRYNAMMRGRMIPTPACVTLHKEIAAINKQIADLDRDASQRLALEKAPIDDVLEIVAIPLLADVMNDLVAGVNGTLRRHGVQETVFGMYTAQIRRAALAMIDTLAASDDGLVKLLDVDDSLVDAVKKKLMSYIKQRLNITK